jgi:urease accessory protein
VTRDPPGAIDDRRAGPPGRSQGGPAPGDTTWPWQGRGGSERGGTGWHAHLRLAFQRRGDATVGLHVHEGPLRVLKSMHPEGAAVCHQVIVHPPGGIVGGDVLRVDIEVAEGAHAVLTTPGATRFYRSAGAEASQAVHATLHAGSRLEWVPLETIVHTGARAANRAVFVLDEGASMIGWDITSLGLPAAGQGFGAGYLLQHLELGGRWLDRGRIDAADERLLRSPLGLAGHPVIGTAWVAWDATAMPAEQLLDDARAVLQAPMLAAASQVQPGLIVVRALADRVEPVSAAFRALRKTWRCALWDVGPDEPRVWGL